MLGLSLIVENFFLARLKTPSDFTMHLIVHHIHIYIFYLYYAIKIDVNALFQFELNFEQILSDAL